MKTVKRSVCSILMTVTALAGAAAGGAADLRALPAHGSGHVYVMRVAGSHSAMRLMRTLMASATAHLFDGRPHVKSGHAARHEVTKSCAKLHSLTR